MRVAIDSGSGGIQGPLLKGNCFEYIPIPDSRNIDLMTYGNTLGRHGRLLVEYFPFSRRSKMARQSIHHDPEFSTFTYGDPTRPKSSLRNLEEGDILIFYCGLEGWDFESPPSLYLMGYFEVIAAGTPTQLGDDAVETYFENNFHVRHRALYSSQRSRLVLVKGGNDSRLLERPVLISSIGQDKNGKKLKVLSKEMRRRFGHFDGRTSIQRSPPRWVRPDFVTKAADFVRSLE